MNLNYSPWKIKLSSSNQLCLRLSHRVCWLDYFQVGPCHIDSSALCAVVVCRLWNLLCTCMVRSDSRIVSNESFG